MKVNRFHVYLFIVFLFLGFLIAFQYQFSKGSRIDSSYTYSVWDKQRELQEKLVGQKKENEALQQQIYLIEEEIRQIEQEAIAEKDTMKTVHQKLENARMVAGLTTVEGTGLIVTLNDSKQAKTLTGDVSSFIVHEQDLRRVVNELFASGAEAVSVNNERMVATSSIRCVGPTIIVNGVKKAPPFEIKAIGDPDTLLSGVEMPGGVLPTLRMWDLEVSTKKLNELTIPGYVGQAEIKTLSEEAVGEDNNEE